LHRIHSGNHRAAGDPQNSLLLTQDTGRQLGIIMALVFGIVTIVEAFMAHPKQLFLTSSSAAGELRPTLP
jgi:hypothetical protein